MARRTVAAGLVTLALAGSLAPASAGACELSQGFKALREALPEVVGDCTTDQRYGANGDGLQETTRGLLVWRKVDNLTAFTDGYRTWINGPFGIQQRLNGERLDWETAATPPPAAPIELNGVVLSDVRVGRLDDPRYGLDVPYIAFTVENRFPATVAVTDERLAFSAAFVDEGRRIRYASALAVPEGITGEGLRPGARTSVLMYALVPSSATTPRAGGVPPTPTLVELYQGRGIGQARTLLRVFPLAG